MSKVQVDFPPITQEQAPDLVAHHLALAMGYFQAMPENVERAMLQAAINERFQGFSLEHEVASTFANCICNRYDDLMAEDLPEDDS